MWWAATHRKASGSPSFTVCAIITWRPAPVFINTFRREYFIDMSHGKNEQSAHLSHFFFTAAVWCVPFFGTVGLFN